MIPAPPSRPETADELSNRSRLAPPRHSSRSSSQSHSQQSPHPQTLPPPAHAPHLKSQTPPQSAVVVNRRKPRHQLLRITRHLVLRPRNPHPRDRIHKPFAHLGNRLSTAYPYSSAPPETPAAASPHASPPDTPPPLPQSCPSAALHPRPPPPPPRRTPHPHPHHRVQIAEQHQPTLRPRRPQLLRKRQHIHQPHPARHRPLTRPLNHRPIRQRIREWHPQLNHIRTLIDRRQRNLPRRRETRIARRQVHHQPRLPFELNRHCYRVSLSCPKILRPHRLRARQLQLPRQDPHILIPAPRKIHHQHIRPSPSPEPSASPPPPHARSQAPAESPPSGSASPSPSTHPHPSTTHTSPAPSHAASHAPAPHSHSPAPRSPSASAHLPGIILQHIRVRSLQHPRHTAARPSETAPHARPAPIPRPPASTPISRTVASGMNS